MVFDTTKAERLNKKQRIIFLLIVGVLLAFVRWVFMFLPVAFLFNALLFGIAGYLSGNHLYYSKWRWGLLLAMPAMIAIMYFFISATMAATISSVGLKNLLSFIIIPVSACAGI